MKPKTSRTERLDRIHKQLWRKVWQLQWRWKRALGRGNHAEGREYDARQQILMKRAEKVSEALCAEFRRQWAAVA